MYIYEPLTPSHWDSSSSGPLLKAWEFKFSAQYFAVPRICTSIWNRTMILLICMPDPWHVSTKRYNLHLNPKPGLGCISNAFDFAFIYHIRKCLPCQYVGVSILHCLNMTGQLIVTLTVYRHIGFKNMQNVCDCITCDHRHQGVWPLVFTFIDAFQSFRDKDTENV